MCLGMSRIHLSSHTRKIGTRVYFYVSISMCLFLFVYKWVFFNFHYTHQKKDTCIRYYVSTNESISINITNFFISICLFLCVYFYLSMNEYFSNSITRTKKRIHVSVIMCLRMSRFQLTSHIFFFNKSNKMCLFFYVSMNEWVSIFILASRMTFRFFFVLKFFFMCNHASLSISERHSTLISMCLSLSISLSMCLLFVCVYACV